MASRLSPHGLGRAFCGTQRGVVRGPDRGFTLLELLGVIALAGVLAGLVFVAADGARARAQRAHAAAELAVLAQALEAFQTEYGDYPATGPAANDPHGAAAADDGPGILFNALTGRRGPAGALVCARRSFVSPAGHTAQRDAWPLVGDAEPSANALLDPWGRRYLYFYRTGAGWARRSPLLFSAGPDGAFTSPGEFAAWDGTLPPGGANADNLVAGE